MIAIIIPVYKSKKHIISVLEKIPDSVSNIIVVDDACPQKTGEYVKATITDKRLSVLYHEENRGVGAATITGYKEALKTKCQVFVKIDGDNQMDPSDVERFALPIVEKKADYTKGNRFNSLGMLQSMPAKRIIGNSILSFFSKASSGYWSLMDPTNGYTAIHRNVIAELPLDKINERFYFESDMLFRLNIINAKFIDIPLKSTYEDEESNLKIHEVVLPFLKNHMSRFLKRLFYNYFLRDFNGGSISLVFAFILITGGFSFGIINWIENASIGQATPTGTIIICAISLITGMNFLIAFLNYDINHKITEPIYPLL